MLKYEKKRVTTTVLTEATCDCCGKELYVTEYNTIVDGNHFTYAFGFGTEYDGKFLDVTLCDVCIVNILGVYGRIK